MRWWALALYWAAGCAQTPHPQPTHPSRDTAPLQTQAADHERRGDLVRAAQYFESALAEHPEDGRILRSVLRVCVAAGRMRQALRHAEHYLHRHPRDWRLRQLVATLQSSVGEFADAQLQLREVVRQQPAEPLPQYLLAVLLWEQAKDGTSASIHFTRYLRLAPNGRHAPQARAALARLGHI